MHYSYNEAMLIMASLVKILKTKAAVAKKLKITPQLFNYWFNRAKKVPLESVVKMALLLEKEKKALKCFLTNDLSHIKTDPANEKFFNIKMLLCTELLISERVQLGLELEAELLQHRNSENRKTLKKPNYFVSQCDKRLGRKSQWIAKQVGLGSKDTYLRAKKVYLSGNSALILAMDDGRFSIHQASMIIQKNVVDLTALLDKSRQEVTDFLKHIK